MRKYWLLITIVLMVACGAEQPAAQAPADHGTGTVVSNDAALDAIVPADYKIEKVDDGFVFIEGPVWVNKDGGYLLFSDVRGNTIYKWAAGAKAVPFLKPVYESKTQGETASGGSNGLTLDAQDRLVMCEHGNRRISRMELSGGERTTLADNYEGKKLNSPNDLAYRSDGMLYFTDPPYGLPGQDSSKLKELDCNGVYRLAPDGKLTLLTKELVRPNGIAFSPDEKTLYVANTGPKKLWMAYDVQEDGSMANGRVFFDATEITDQGGPDGMKVDSAGNLYCTGPGGVLILSPDGKHLGTIQPAELPANVAWGDADMKTLYMTARTGLYRIRLNIAGPQPPGER